MYVCLYVHTVHDSPTLTYICMLLLLQLDLFIFLFFSAIYFTVHMSVKKEKKKICD